MIQMQQALGQPVDAAALTEIMEATRPGQGAGDPLPEWYVIAECMRNYHWTERQFWEENSPAMITRLLWLEGLHAEKAEKDSKKGASSSNYYAGGRSGLEGSRPPGQSVSR